MIFTKNIAFKNFQRNKKNISIKKNLNLILKDKNEILKSLGPEYKYSFSKNILKKYKSFSIMRIIGMGGSILGTKAIYSFLKHKI